MRRYLKNLISLVFLIFLSGISQGVNFKNDTLKFSLIEPKAKESKDIPDSQKIKLAMFYETIEEYNKAFEIYIELNNSKIDRISNEASEGVKRINHKINPFRKKKTEICSKIFNYLWPIISILLLLIILKVVLLVKKVFNYKRKIRVKPIKSTSSTDELFTHFKAYLEWNVYLISYYSELKTKAVGDELSTSKPAIRIDEISSLVEVTMMALTPQWFSVLDRVYYFLFPADYTVSAYINSGNNNLCDVVINLKRKRKVLKLWDNEIATAKLSSELKSLTFEILRIIEDTIHDEKKYSNK
jgi:hypothetical protein